MSAVVAHSSREPCSALQSDLFHCLLSTGLCWGCTHGRDSGDLSDAGHSSHPACGGNSCRASVATPGPLRPGHLVLARSGLVGNCVKVSGSWE